MSLANEIYQEHLKNCAEETDTPHLARNFVRFKASLNGESLNYTDEELFNDFINGNKMENEEEAFLLSDGSVILIIPLGNDNIVFPYDSLHQYENRKN